MNYAIISVGDEQDRHWSIPESKVSGDALGQVLKRYKNRMIMVVDADEAADIVERLNQGSEQGAEAGMIDAEDAGPQQPAA